MPSSTDETPVLCRSSVVSFSLFSLLFFFFPLRLQYGFVSFFHRHCFIYFFVPPAASPPSRVSFVSRCHRRWEFPRLLIPPSTPHINIVAFPWNNIICRRGRLIMACLCILGVCIPYSALLPLAAFLLRYISAPLANLKVLIKKFLHWAGLLSSSDISVDCCASSDSAASCCYPKRYGAASKEAVMTITSEKEWEEHHSNYETIICKFTATWCKPCKLIEPHFQLIAEEYRRSDSAAFVKVRESCRFFYSAEVTIVNVCMSLQYFSLSFSSI